MRYLLLVLLAALALTTCNKLEAQSEMMRVAFDHNAPSDSVIYYTLYLYETPDTTTSPFADSAFVDTMVTPYLVVKSNSDLLIQLDPNSGLISFMVSANGEFVQAAITATNQWYEGPLNVLEFIQKDYRVIPARVSNFRYVE